MLSNERLVSSGQVCFEAHLATAPQHIPTQHGMLPQHLVCKYELNCEYCNITLAWNKAPWWWSDKIETCRSVLKCFKSVLCEILYAICCHNTSFANMNWIVNTVTYLWHGTKLPDDDLTRSKHVGVFQSVLKVFYVKLYVQYAATTPRLQIRIELWIL
jgi:hypothetical protein